MRPPRGRTKDTHSSQVSFIYLKSKTREKKRPAKLQTSTCHSRELEDSKQKMGLKSIIFRTDDFDLPVNVVPNSPFFFFIFSKRMVVKYLVVECKQIKNKLHEWIPSDFMHSNMTTHLAFNLAFDCSTKVHV